MHPPDGFPRVQSVRHHGACCCARASAMGPCATMGQNVLASQERAAHQAVQLLEGMEYGACLGGHPAAPVWCSNSPVPFWGWDVGRDIDHQPNGDLVEEREVIGARVAALIDARFPALRVLREDQINCAVTRGVEGPPAHNIIEMVRGARRAAKF